MKYELENKSVAVITALVLCFSAFLGIVGNDFVNVIDNAAADQGGPDAWGYIWTNNTGSPSVPTMWLDGVTGGTATGLDDDDWMGPVNMGMTFEYYGITYSSVYICSNGWISFVMGDGWYQDDEDIGGSAFPGDSNYEGCISPYSFDLQTAIAGGYGEIYYKYIAGTVDQFVVTWDGVPHYSMGPVWDNQTFQIVLNETGEIWFNYQTMINPDAGANVGIENEDSTIGLDYDTMAGPVYSGLSIEFRYIPPPYRVMLDPDFQVDTGYPTWDVDYTLTVYNQGTNHDTYDLSSVSAWPTVIRDIADTADITEIYVPSGSSENILVRVSVPAGAQPGDADFAMITATSQNNSMEDDTADIITAVPVLPPWLDDMESGSGAWRTWDDGDGTVWEHGNPSGGPGPASAYSPINCWGTNLMIPYSSDGETTLTSPFIDLTIATSANLTFWHWYEMNGGFNDGGWVEVSDNFGQTWTRITPKGGYPDNEGLTGEPCYAGSSGGWLFAEFDLSDYLGEMILIQFHFIDAPWDFIELAGWYVDDVSIWASNYSVDIIPDSFGFGDPATQVQYTLTVYNNGNFDDSFTLSVSGNVWATTIYDSTGTFVISNTGALPPGGSIDIVVKVDIPPLVFPGEFDIAMITARSNNDTVVVDSARLETNVPIIPPWFDDMELGVGPWRTWDSGMGTAWELGDPTLNPYGPGGAYSGSNCWGTNILTNYTTNGEAILSTPYIDLTLAVDANLTFWHWYDINGGWNDGGWVEVSDDFGATWSRISPVGGYPDMDGWFMEPCYAGQTGGWVQAEFDLSMFTGDRILIQFHFFDVFFDMINRSGWYVDDVDIQATYVTFGVNLEPEEGIIFESDGTLALHRMKATNIGSSGPDTFDLTSLSFIGWTVTFFDLGMNPINTVGPLGTGSFEEFYLGVDIPPFTPPMTQETTWVTATSQNDPSFPPADDTSTMYTEVLAPILFVDDDAGIDTDVNFTAALSAGTYEYNVWDYMSYGPPDLTDLEKHTVVIWATGNDWNDNSLMPQDRSVIGSYLDGGGKLYLSSSLAGIDATNFFGGTENWLSWYQTYLHSDFQNMGAGGPSSINGVIGDQLSEGLMYQIHQGDFNMNLFQTWTDNDPMGDGEVCFNEASPSQIAIKADTGTYRMVYTAFDFSAVNGATNRTVLMDRIIQWLLLGDLPYVIETDPFDTETNVAEGQNVVVVYSETMNTAITPTLTQVGGPDPGGWTFLGWTTTYETNDTATWSHSNWALGIGVNMSVSGGEDLEANTASGYLFNFTINPGAITTATATGPLGGPTNVADIMITYTTSGGPATVDLYYTTNTMQPYTWTFIATDTVINGSYPWTIPADGTYGWFAVSPDESAPVGTDAPEASVYEYDGTPPDVTSTEPLDTAVGVALDKIVNITFDEQMSTPSFTFTVEPNPGGLTPVWDPGDMVVRISHNNFAAGVRVWVNITAITDVAGNDLSTLPYSFYFDTLAVVLSNATATGPLGGPTNLVDILINYSYSGSPASVDLYYTTDSMAPYTWILAGTDNVVNGSFPWTLPADGSYGWMAVATDESAPTPSDAPEAAYYTYDGTPPDVLTTDPLHLSIGVLVSKDVVITFNETMDDTTFTYTMEPDPGGLSLSWDGLFENVTISHNDFGVGLRIYVNITAITDMAGNDLSVLPYAFYFDTTATSAIATGPIGGPTNVASINIFYTPLGGPASVDLYYTTDTSIPYTWALAGTDSPADGSFPWVISADGSYGWFAVSPDESAPTPTDAPEESAYIYDGTPPNVDSTDPVNMSVGVAINKLVDINFNETMNTGTFTYTVEPNPGGLSLAWSGGNQTVTISHIDFVLSTRYWVNITAVEDEAGNSLDPLPYSFYFDTAATSAIASGPISGLTNVADIMITYLTSGAPATVDLYYTTDTSAPYTWTLAGTDVVVNGSFPWTVPADGSYGWIAVSPDESAPTPTDAPEAMSYVYDGTPPDVVSTDPAHMSVDVLVGQSVVINFTEEMNITTLTYTIFPDPGGLLVVWAPGNMSVTISHNDFPVATRIYVNITAITDLAGNDLITLPYSFYFDTVLGVTIANATGPTGGPTNVAGIFITYETVGSPASVDLYYTTDTSAPYTWTLAGTDNTPGDLSFPWTVPADGTYGWLAVSPDESAPTPSDAPEAESYIYDGTPPQITITTPVDGVTGVLVGQSIIIKFSEPVDTSTWLFASSPDPGGWGESWNATNDEVTLTHTSFGFGITYTITVLFANDTAGNALGAGPVPNPWDFTTQTDSTPPTVVSISPSKPSPVTGGNLTFEITFSEDMNTAVDPTVTFGDSSPYNDHTIIQTFYSGSIWRGYFIITGSTGDGLNRISVSGGQDVAGNPMATDTNYSFEIDTEEPTSSVDTLSDYQTSLTFDVSYSDSDSGGSGVDFVELYYRRDGGTWTKYGTTHTSGTVSFTAPGEGFYEFYTIATDNAGNQEDPPAPLAGDASTTVDTTIPSVVTVTISDPTPVQAGAVTFTITFSEDMDDSQAVTVTFGTASPYNTHTVLLSTYTGDTWIGTFTFDTSTGDGAYHLSITGAQDFANHEIPAHTPFTFVVDTTTPTVTSTTPTGTGVAITTPITITFAESMDHTSVENAFTYTDGTTTWTTANGSVSWSGNTMTFNPTTDFTHGATYTVNVGAGATDAAGNPITAYSWSFTVVSEPDTTAPTVSSISLSGDDVKVTDRLSITFDEAMDHASVEGAISVSPGVTITDYSWVGNTLTVTLESDLEYDTEYTVTISTAAEDEAGNSLASPYSGQFKTEAESEPADNTFLFLLLIIIVIIVLFLVIYFMKRGKKEEPLGPGYSEEEELPPGEIDDGTGAEPKGPPGGEDESLDQVDDVNVGEEEAPAEELEDDLENLEEPPPPPPPEPPKE